MPPDLTSPGRCNRSHALGNPDTAHGKSVMISVGMSNATQEFASKGNAAFKPRADSDLSKNPQLTIIDGAQEGKDAPAWLDPDAATWATVNQRVAVAGVTPQQVLVQFGVTGVLADRTLELHDRNGAVIASNGPTQSGPRSRRLALRLRTLAKQRLCGHWRLVATQRS